MEKHLDFRYSIPRPPGGPLVELSAEETEFSMKSELEILTTFHQIQNVREQWEKYQWFPEADPEFFRLIVESRPEIEGPYVIAVRRRDRVEAVLVGRVETVRLSDSGKLQPKLKVLEVVYGGLLGDWREENLDRLLQLLNQGLSAGVWNAVRFRMLNVQSPLWARAQTQFPRICRGSRSKPALHWKLRLPGSYEEFCQSLDGKIRKNHRRHAKRLENAFEDVSVRQLERVEDLQTIVQTSEAIMAKTYQHGFSKSWTSEEMAKRVALWLEKGVFQGFFLSVHGRACAYQHIYKYRGRAFAMGTAYDPEFQCYGVGRYIQLKAIEELCEAQDASELDFGYGDAEYKRELCRCHDEEADLVFFSSRGKSLLANGLRTGENAVMELMKRVLKSAGIFSLVKRVWRNSQRSK
jgi:hypothetical protein